MKAVLEFSCSIRVSEQENESKRSSVIGLAHLSGSGVVYFGAVGLHDHIPAAARPTGDHAHRCAIPHRLGLSVACPCRQNHPANLDQSVDLSEQWSHWPTLQFQPSLLPADFQLHAKFDHMHFCTQPNRRLDRRRILTRDAAGALASVFSSIARQSCRPAVPCHALPIQTSPRSLTWASR